MKEAGPDVRSSVGKKAAPSFFVAQGLLARVLSAYEERPSQQRFSEAVAQIGRAHV